jgi:hypothetical protein
VFGKTWNDDDAMPMRIRINGRRRDAEWPGAPAEPDLEEILRIWAAGAPEETHRTGIGSCRGWPY